MNGNERREAILEAIRDAAKPVSGTALAERFKVSRQVIVQDVALLRSSGVDVVSTNRGYILGSNDTAPDGRATRLFKVRHSIEQTADELNAIVDLGAWVENVMVNHRTYGQVEAELNIKSRRDVQKFLEELRAGVSSPLMTITDGYHFHLVSAETADILDEVEAALGELGLLAPLTEFERETF